MTQFSNHWLNAPYVNGMGRYLHAVEQPFVERGLTETRGVKTILDVGGGTGRFAIPLHRAGYVVTVTDIDAESLALITAQEPSIHVHQVSIGGAWPVPDRSVDCVMAIGVPGVAGTALFWSECARVLRPTGPKLIIAWTTNRASYKGAGYMIKPLLRPFLSASGKRWVAREGAYTCTVQHVLRCARAAQCEILQCVGYNWAPMTRTSNSRMLPWIGWLERILGMRYLAAWSPWVLIRARM